VSAVVMQARQHNKAQSAGIPSFLDYTIQTWSRAQYKHNRSPQVLTNYSDDDDDKNAEAAAVVVVVVVVAAAAAAACISYNVFFELCIKRIHTESQGKTLCCDMNV
jgi:hypothetical protein